MAAARSVMGLTASNGLRRSISHSASGDLASTLLNSRTLIGKLIRCPQSRRRVSSSLLIRTLERLYHWFPHRIRSTAASTVPRACVQVESVKEPLNP